MYHTILSLIPNFWFDPKMLAKYRTAVIRLPQYYLSACLGSLSNVGTTLGYLEHLQLDNTSVHYYLLILLIVKTTRYSSPNDHGANVMIIHL